MAAGLGLAFAGRGAAMTALIWVLYASSGSAWLVSGAMLATFGVSTATSPFTGHAGDRHDRRRVVVVSAIFTALALAVCAPLALAGLTIPIVIAIVVASATHGAISPAIQGAVPALVEDEQRSAANSLVNAAKSAGFMLGPGLGGALLAVIGPAGVFLGSALMLAAAAILVGRLDGEFRAAPHEDGPGGHMDGFRRLMSDGWLRLLTLAWALVMVGVGPVIVAEVVLARHFAVGSLGYGLIAVFWDGGGVIGALAGRRISRRLEQPAVVGGCVAIAFGFAVVGLTPIFWPVLVGMFISGSFDAFGVVAAQNIIQRRTPDHLRSRVSAALDAVVLGTMALSFALGAPLVELLGPQGVYLAAGAVAALGALLLLPMLVGMPDLPPRVRATRRRIERPVRTIARNVSYGRRRVVERVRRRAPRTRA
jgi:MFS family permease